jgi:hypothetical protein
VSLLHPLLKDAKNASSPTPTSSTHVSRRSKESPLYIRAGGSARLIADTQAKRVMNSRLLS